MPLGQGVTALWLQHTPVQQGSLPLLSLPVFSCSQHRQKTGLTTFSAGEHQVLILSILGTEMALCFFCFMILEISFVRVYYFLRDKCSEKFPKDATEEATCGLIASHVFKNNCAWCGTDAALITRFFFNLIVGD